MTRPILVGTSAVLAVGVIIWSLAVLAPMEVAVENALSLTLVAAPAAALAAFFARLSGGSFYPVVAGAWALARASRNLVTVVFSITALFLMAFPFWFVGPHSVAPATVACGPETRFYVYGRVAPGTSFACGRPFQIWLPPWERRGLAGRLTCATKSDQPFGKFNVRSAGPLNASCVNSAVRAFAEHRPVRCADYADGTAAACEAAEDGFYWQLTRGPFSVDSDALIEKTPARCDAAHIGTKALGRRSPTGTEWRIGTPCAASNDCVPVMASIPAVLTQKCRGDDDTLGCGGYDLTCRAIPVPQLWGR